MIRRALLAFACVAVLGIAGTAAAQNQLTNGSFASNVLGWTAESVASVAFSSMDANGSGSSGSALVTNSSPGASNGAGMSQCVGGITAGGSYDYLGKVFIPTGQARTGDAQIGVAWKDGVGCTGATVGSQPRQSTTTLGSWVSLQQLNITAPVGAVSVLFVAFPSKVEAGGTLAANFDDLVLRPAGTPVSLTTFDSE